MSIVVRYAPPSLTPQKYDDAVSHVDKALGQDMPDGCDYHVAFVGPDGNVLVSEIWDSREQWEAFGEKLMPLLGEAGIEAGEPQVFEIHNVQRR